MPEAKLSRWEKALDYIPHVLVGAVILWGYTQCEATKEAQKNRVWRLDQCFIGQHTGEKLCIRGTRLYSSEECQEMKAGLPSLAGFISAACEHDQGDPRQPWKPAPISN
jgi:hypothetical protein